MRYTAIVVLLAMWLTFAVTNASPLPGLQIYNSYYVCQELCYSIINMHSTWLTAKTDSGTGKFDIQKLIGELIGTVEKENENGTYIIII